jgi:hypothetical protein
MMPAIDLISCSSTIRSVELLCRSCSTTYWRTVLCDGPYPSPPVCGGATAAQQLDRSDCARATDQVNGWHHLRQVRPANVERAFNHRLVNSPPSWTRLLPFWPRELMTAAQQLDRSDCARATDQVNGWHHLRQRLQ